MGISGLSCRLEGRGTGQGVCGAQNCTPEAYLWHMFCSCKFLKKGQMASGPTELGNKGRDRSQGLSENMRISTLDRRCQKGLGLWSNYWAAWGGKQDILALSHK